MQSDQMSIGEFARYSRLSPKALRLYDELGLLEPARVDEDSGYRHYSASQLERARLIAALRQLQIPLAEIKLIVSLEPDAAAERISAHWNAIQTQHTARRDLARYLIDRCKEGGMPCMKSPHGTSPPEAFCVSSAASKELTGHWRSAKRSS